MSDPATVSFTIDDALRIATQLGSLAALADPAIAAEIALAQGAVNIIRTSIIPRIRSLQESVISVAEQAAIAAESAVLRSQVGAPSAPAEPAPNP